MINSGQRTQILIILIVFGFLFCSGCTQTTDTGPAARGTLTPAVHDLSASQQTTATPASSRTPKTVSCGSDLTGCGNSCVDLQTDASHCGVCGKACPSGKVCTEGTCDVACKAGRTDCDGSCVNTDTSVRHCGKCGNACSSDETCTVGKCIQSDGNAGGQNQGPRSLCVSAGKLWCNGLCIDQKTDPDNCGSCNYACAQGGDCAGGRCRYSSHPGGNAGGQDQQSICTNAGKLWCSGACTDQTTDTSNCGSCGNSCASGENCQGGVCGSSGGTGGGLHYHVGGGTVTLAGPGVMDSLACTSSGGLWCNGACVDQNTDTSNCGSCGNACGSGVPCNSGKCLSWSGQWFIVFPSTTGDSYTLVQGGDQVSGSCSCGGSFSGTTSGNPPVLSGTWYTKDLLYGTEKSGQFQFSMRSDGKSFSGKWNYNTDPTNWLGGNWQVGTKS